MAVKKRGLGRGLDALLGTSSSASVETPLESSADAGLLRMIPVEQIQAGAYQPRRHWDEAALDELAASIRARGLIQPVVLRQLAPQRYELIAGERRWRAAQRAALSEIPALIKDVEEAAIPAMALIENIQRQDLTPLEEADALKRLIDDFDLTHQQAAEAVGRSRASVSNLIRLTELPLMIKQMLEQRQLDMGHARCLLPLPEREAESLALEAAHAHWSVRELEAAVRRAQQNPHRALANPAPVAAPTSDLVAVERRLAERFATRVQVTPGRGGRGRLVIHYQGQTELDGILAKLNGQD